MTDTVQLEAAAMRARLARERLAGTAQEIQDRLAPARLLDDAVSSARAGAEDFAERAVDVAVTRPRTVAVGAALVVALLVRKPLMRLGRKLRRS